MKRKIEINVAWAAWHLLTDLNDKIWRHYENDFLDIILKEDDDLMFFKERSDEFIPF